MKTPTLLTRSLLVATTAALLLSATSAQAATDDDLDQTIDPDQAQGTGQVVRDRGHVDFGPTLATGAWAVQLHDDTETPKYWRDVDDVVLRVNDASMLEVPDDEAYDFLGQEAGSEVYVIPQTQKTDVIWVGWNTQEPGVLEIMNLGTTLSVLGVDGPGDVSVYLQSGNFGDPEPLWSTSQPFPQQSWIEVNTHTHANWVFSDPGVYLVDIRFDADLIDGTTESAEATLRFAVGDETNADDAFDAVSTVDEAAAGDEAVPAPAEEESDASGADTASGIPTAVVVSAVVGAVTLALVIAVIVMLTATRRAKQRVLAARASREAGE
ncbi:choice-of-anchor M domain-containing protein [Labedella endophytica]|uniref:Surface-anchored protein n=1 Tax=Labedella endophytica TaxID=1523160 RepID=A0A3S0VDG4_9MICO|nr:choice-of-anchor M domain-containing protein [Labedella endophytica]RUR03545.1 hypothetical protein ELQ94_03170 [Labedella endophytica]